jgi:hypothetical protein
LPELLTKLNKCSFRLEILRGIEGEGGEGRELGKKKRKINEGDLVIDWEEMKEKLWERERTVIAWS